MYRAFDDDGPSKFYGLSIGGCLVTSQTLYRRGNLNLSRSKRSIETKTTYEVELYTRSFYFREKLLFFQCACKLFVGDDIYYGELFKVLGNARKIAKRGESLRKANDNNNSNNELAKQQCREKSNVQSERAHRPPQAVL